MVSFHGEGCKVLILFVIWLDALKIYINIKINQHWKKKRIINQSTNFKKYIIKGQITIPHDRTYYTTGQNVLYYRTVHIIPQDSTTGQYIHVLYHRTVQQILYHKTGPYILYHNTGLYILYHRTL